MSRRFRPRLSYANVASTLALVLALGGTTYAATAINGNTIKKRSIPASKIKKDTLTGTEIKESKLGKVPLTALADNAKNAVNATNAAAAANATHANNADTVGGQAPSSFKLSCPQGTTLAIGQCFELTLRAAQSFSDASKTCGAAGRRLPTISELDSARQNGVAVGVPPSSGELSSSAFNDGASNKVFAIDPMGNLILEFLTNARPFRCIQNPTN
jgi:hypothetical protein